MLFLIGIVDLVLFFASLVGNDTLFYIYTLSVLTTAVLFASCGYLVVAVLKAIILLFITVKEDMLYDTWFVSIMMEIGMAVCVMIGGV